MGAAFIALLLVIISIGPKPTPDSSEDRIAAACAREYAGSTERAACHITLDEMAMDKLDREKSERLVKDAGL